jgi:Cys-tRNA(Pro)/Cys-tRNA(Cys) deacylase
MVKFVLKKFLRGQTFMDNLKAILQKNNVSFEIIHHEHPIHSAQEGADYFGIEIGQTALTFSLREPL